MTEEELIEAVKAIAEGLRSDLTGSLAKLDEKCSALSDSVTEMKKKADAIVSTSQGMQNDMTRRGALRSDADRSDPNEYDQNTPNGARLTAADSVPRSEFAALAHAVADLKLKSTRTSVDRNAVADLQAKADSVMRLYGDRAEPALPGESTVDYSIRLARKMQPHSKLWSKVDLNLIRADQVALHNAIQLIHDDARAASENTEGMKPFQYREITEESRGGHRRTRFIGRGTIYAQMSRPVRHVAHIGVRNVHQNA